MKGKKNSKKVEQELKKENKKPPRKEIKEESDDDELPIINDHSAHVAKEADEQQRNSKGEHRVTFEELPEKVLIEKK